MIGYKIGPARTHSGKEIYLTEVDGPGGRLFGRYPSSSTWIGAGWTPDQVIPNDNPKADARRRVREFLDRSGGTISFSLGSVVGEAVQLLAQEDDT